MRAEFALSELAMLDQLDQSDSEVRQAIAEFRIAVTVQAKVLSARIAQSRPCR